MDKVKSLLHLAFGMLLIFLVSCSKDIEKDIGTVTISQITPDTGTAGTDVIILGTGFDSIKAEANIVKFNGVETDVSQATSTVLMVKVPNEAGTGPVTVSVGNRTATGPEFTYIDEPIASTTYFIKFKLDGEWKIFETDQPGFQSCGVCSCCLLPPLDEDRYASMEICQEDFEYFYNSVSASDIQSWNKMKIHMGTDTYPISSFGFEESGNYYDSEYASDQSEGWVDITDIVADGELYGYKAYKVTGSFQCKVATDSGGTDLAITEGSFIIRLTEDF